MRKPILFLLITAVSLPAQNLFDNAQRQETSPSAPLQYELNGYIRCGGYVVPIVDKSRYESKYRYGEATLKLRLRKGQWGDTFSEMRFR